MAKRFLRGVFADPLQNSSYLAKVSKERLKLHASLTEAFHADIQRCFQDRILTNLHFIRSPAGDSVSPTVVIECHTALLKKRLRPLWGRCLASPSFQSTPGNIITIDIDALGISEADLCELVRSLYTCPSALLSDKWQKVQRSNAEISNDGDTGVEEVESGVASVSFTEAAEGVKSPSRTDAGVMQDIHEMLNDDEDQDIHLELDNQTTVPAHRFILACRSKFFEAMLSGRWRESSANTISLPEISHQSLMLILNHLYGSTEGVPESCNIVELNQHVDMWEISSLREVIILILKKEYCHFFHKPCSSCLNSVPDCLVFSHEHDYSALKESCLRWLHKYISRTWNQKSFATLPQDLLKLCCQYSANQLALETCITMLTNIDDLCSSLPSVRWADEIRPFCERLREDTMHFTAQNFTHPVVQQNFRSLLEGMGWSESLMKSLLNEIVKQLNSESASTVLILALQLKDACDVFDVLVCNAPPLIDDFYNQCLRFIAQNLSKVQYSSTWSNIPAAIQQKLKQTAVYVDDRGPPTKMKPKLSSSLRKQKKGGESKATAIR